MKIRINNLVELVDALKEHGNIYCPDVAVVKLYSDGHIAFSNNGMRFPLSLDNFRWGSEFETVVPLQDKQPVWCWDNTDNFSRIVRFYDAKNNCAFSSYTGVRNGNRYSSYEPIPMNEDGSFPDGFEWMEEAQKQLED